jgi:small subunit ribosomal protein S19e
MITPYDVDPLKLVEKAAEKLKAVPEIKAPEWASFVKTGVHKDRAPDRPDWWQIRVAALLRTVYTRGPIGVSKLRVKYGGKKNRGAKPEHFKKGSGSVARKALQQLQNAGLVSYQDKGVHKGRKITGKGKSFLDKVAKEVASEKPKKEEANPEAAEKKKEQ